MFTKTAGNQFFSVSKGYKIQEPQQLTDLSSNANDDNLFNFTYTGPSLIGMKCSRVNTAKLTEGHEFHMKTTQIFTMTSITTQKLRKLSTKSNTNSNRRPSLNRTQTRTLREMRFANNSENRTSNISYTRNKKLTTRLNRWGSTEESQIRNILTQSKGFQINKQDLCRTTTDASEPNPFKNK